LESDLLTIMQAVTNEALTPEMVKFKDASACCVIVASKGYPVKYENGFEIKLPETSEDGTIYVAGAKKDGDKLLSAGGRVLGVTAIGDNLEQAIEKAYDLTKKVEFSNGFYRSDIGKRALKAFNN